MKIEDAILAVQAKLGLKVDGVAGEKTWTAIHKAIVGDEPVSDNGGDIDPRSAKNILTLLPEVREPAKLLIRAASERGIEIRITSALRTYEEQDALYEIGRSRPNDEGKWKTVTDVRGGYSNHNFGLAFDVTIFKDGKPVWESPAYKTLGQLGKEIGLAWGGDWAKPDEPHFELRPKWADGMSETKMVAELRARKTTNRSFFT